MADFPAEILSASTTFRATVAEILGTGEIQVRRLGAAEAYVLCDFLQTTDRPVLELALGDQVLVLAPESPDDKGVVLGRIGGYKQPDTQDVRIEAGQSLTLQCGEAMLRLRADGKLLSKGVDVASIARRTNRVKGGSVQIN